jgi:hypothetical protein
MDQSIELVKKAIAPIEIKLIKAPALTQAEIAKEFGIPVITSVLIKRIVGDRL